MVIVIFTSNFIFTPLLSRETGATKNMITENTFCQTPPQFLFSQLLQIIAYLNYR